MAKIQLNTTMGTIIVELDEERAPISTANILKYVDNKHYDGTVFHRVINGFMIQGGGYDENLKKKPPLAPIKNEATNGLKNKRGTVAMARTPEVDSATAQFFINVVDNDFLDHRNETPEGYGYAVVGEVLEGMDVVDAIKEMPTGPKGPFAKDCPLETVKIESAICLED